jgi:hypothetical protein
LGRTEPDETSSHPRTSGFAGPCFSLVSTTVFSSEVPPCLNMDPEPALPVVSFVDDRKSKLKIQKILDKRQKKRKAEHAAYRVENKAPVGMAAAKASPKSSKASDTPNKKRKLSEESDGEDNFETMVPGAYHFI